MRRDNLREWLGLRWADLLVYLAAAAIVALYLVANVAVEVALAVLRIGDIANWNRGHCELYLSEVERKIRTGAGPPKN